MPKGIINLSPNCSLNELRIRIQNLTGRVFGNLSRMNADGGVFASGYTTDLVVSAYYHPSKTHHASAHGGTNGQFDRCVAPAGKWAVAWVAAGIGNRKTYYGFS